MHAQLSPIHRTSPLFVASVFLLTLATTLLAIETAPWTWTKDIPAAYSPSASPTPVPAHRTAAEVEAYFKANPSAPKLPHVIAHFGPPDGVSRQFINSLARGSASTSKEAYTLRFILGDGGEMHLWDSLGKGTSAALAIRYDKSGKGHLLYK